MICGHRRWLLCFRGQRHAVQEDSACPGAGYYCNTADPGTNGLIVACKYLSSFHSETKISDRVTRHASALCQAGIPLLQRCMHGGSLH